MKKKNEINKFLGNDFAPKHTKAVLGHFEAAILSFKDTDWEKSINKSGKFVEAIVKLICDFAGITLPNPRQFSVNREIVKIQQIPSSDLCDSLRIQITRACSFAYDLASNRGARHDPSEIDPNEMDATVSCSICSWILAELTRLSSKGKLNINQAKALVDSLVERQFPMFENIDGRIYLNEKDKCNNTIEIAVLLLYSFGKNRISREALLEQLDNNEIKESSINLSRLRPYIDVDADKKIMLRGSGVKLAEQIKRR